MIKSKYLKPIILVSIVTILIACGGDSSSSDKNGIQAEETSSDDPIVNQKPIANAGEDQNITFGNQVILSAELSSNDDGDLTYEWSLNNKAISQKESFVLENFKKEGIYEFYLKVTDTQGESSSDSIIVKTFSDTVVMLKTNQGDISLKMKSTIAPKAVENFVTHSHDGYYNNLQFHRVIQNFMIQGGDPKGNGRGGESIWGEPFKDEFDSAVQFDRPYLLAMANAGPNSNGSQFFITVTKAKHLNNKHTIFGEVINGQDIVHKIEKSGNSQSTIKEVTIIFDVP